MRWVVGIGILAVIATNIEFDRLGRIWRPMLLLYLAGGAAVLVAAQLVSAARWKVLLLEDDVMWRYLVRLYLIGNFFSAFLPTSVGGDAVRAGALAQDGVSLKRSVASVLFDRILGVAGMVPLFAVGALLVAADPTMVLGRLSWEASPGQVVGGGATALLLAAGAAVYFRERLLARITQFGDELRDLAGSKGKLALVLGLGVLVQAMYILAWGILAPATGLEIGWAMLLFAVPVVSVAAMLPVSIAGLGVREGVWIVLLGGGFATADVVAFSLLYFVAFSLAGGVGGALYMIKGLSSGSAGKTAGEMGIPDRAVN